jgi:hypothetical protein
VERAVEEYCLEIYDRIPGQAPFKRRLLNTLVNRRYVCLRYDAADDLVLELVSIAASKGDKLDPAVSVLASAAGLFLYFPLYLDRGLEGFQIGKRAVFSIQPRRCTCA